MAKKLKARREAKTPRKTRKPLMLQLEEEARKKRRRKQKSEEDHDKKMHLKV